VVGVSAAVVADRDAHVFRDGIEIREDVLDGLLLETRAGGDRRVEFAHVRSVMFVVVNLHGLRVDVRFERVVIVVERRKFEDTLGGGCGRRCGWFGTQCGAGDGDGAGGQGEILQGGASCDHGGEW
jgi:hypothetical protein